MKGKIGLEEHFAIDDTLNDSKGFFPDEIWVEVRERILDLHGRRLRLMDEFGMEMMILSLNAPAIQGVPDAKKANEIARKANDYLAEQVQKRPDRFQALAALPLQDPEMATKELQRCVKDLGMVGALANGFSQIGDPNTIAYLDEKQYWPFWQVCDQLDVPFYLHPRNPLPTQRRIYEGREELLGPTWAFAVETGTHALRLITGGVFDRHPGVQVILGHLGEQLPFAMARLTQRMAHNPRVSLARPPREIFRENFHITTSGNAHTPSLLGALMELGAERVMFAADYPFEEMADTTDWFDALDISTADRRKIGRANAGRLLGL